VNNTAKVRVQPKTLFVLMFGTFLACLALNLSALAQRLRGFSFVRAPAAAGSILEFGGAVHPLGRLCFFHSLECFCFFLLSDCYLLPGCCFCLDPDGPDETQQFAAHRSDDLSLVFACRRQLAVAHVQPMLGLPGYLLNLLQHTLLSLP
jgi:hypothetical protein